MPPLTDSTRIAELRERLAMEGSGARSELASLDEATLEALEKELREGSSPPKRVLAMTSGKGGVGKSTVTVNLALALSRLGYRVGLLDADVYGFSVPAMIGTSVPPVSIGELIIAPMVHGVRCMSMGYLVEEDQPVVWRGPMLHKALEQFIKDVWWDQSDFLLVDMPPGTGDVALSMAEHLPATEVLVVTNPQPASSRVAQRSGLMARNVKLSVRGVVENMSWFTGDDGKRYELWGRGGGAQLADMLKVKLLAQIPFLQPIRQGADDGVPPLIADPAGEAAKAFEELAKAVVALGPARVYRKELKLK